MKTQGITIMTGNSQNIKSEKKSKDTTQDFQLFFNNNGKQSETIKPDASQKVVVKTSKNIADKTVRDTATEMQTPSDAQMAQAAENVVSYLAVKLQLPVEDVEAMLQDSGLQPTDLLVGSDQGIQLNLETLQNALMTYHGFDDKAVFVTNDQIGQEMDQIRQELQELLDDGTSLLVDEELPESSLLENTANVFDVTNDVDRNLNMTSEETDVSDSSDDVITPVSTSAKELPENGDAASEQEFSQEGSALESEISSRDSIRISDPTPVNSSMNTFVERLGEALENATADTEVQSQQTTDILDQVVSQIRLRVVADTTKLEMQLHPASLGKVNVAVSAAAGVTTAVLTVENQAAKEALESQMIILKENFQQQGLKVDAVEVTVSEFGLDQREQQNEQQSQRDSRHKEFSHDETKENSNDTKETSRETTMQRRDQNSTIDYTA